MDLGWWLRLAKILSNLLKTTKSSLQDPLKNKAKKIANTSLPSYLGLALKRLIMAILKEVKIQEKSGTMKSYNNLAS